MKKIFIKVILFFFILLLIPNIIYAGSGCDTIESINNKDCFYNISTNDNRGLGMIFKSKDGNYYCYDTKIDKFKYRYKKIDLISSYKNIGPWSQGTGKVSIDLLFDKQGNFYTCRKGGIILNEGKLDYNFKILNNFYIYDKFHLFQPNYLFFYSECCDYIESFSNDFYKREFIFKEINSFNNIDQLHITKRNIIIEKNNVNLSERYLYTDFNNKIDLNNIDFIDRKTFKHYKNKYFKDKENLYYLCTKKECNKNELINIGKYSILKIKYKGFLNIIIDNLGYIFIKNNFLKVILSGDNNSLLLINELNKGILLKKNGDYYIWENSLGINYIETYHNDGYEGDYFNTEKGVLKLYIDGLIIKGVTLDEELVIKDGKIFNGFQCKTFGNYNIINQLGDLFVYISKLTKNEQNDYYEKIYKIINLYGNKEMISEKAISIIGYLKCKLYSGILKKYKKWHINTFIIYKKDNCYYGIGDTKGDVLTQLMFDKINNTSSYDPYYLKKLDEKIVSATKGIFYSNVVCNIKKGLDIFYGNKQLYIISGNKLKSYKNIPIFRKKILGNEKELCNIKFTDKLIINCNTDVSGFNGELNQTKYNLGVYYFSIDGDLIKTD